MIREEDLFKIGQFNKPHGIKGEISLHTDFDTSDISGYTYFVCDMDGIFVPFFIDSQRQKSSSTTLIKFENINSEEKVKILSGKTAYLSSDFLPSNDEKYITFDYLSGFTVIDEKFGVIGTVKDIDDSTINILIKVDYKDNEILIPVAIVKDINQENKTMKFSLPEGFLEI